MVDNDTITTFGIWNRSKVVKADLDKRYYYYIRNSVRDAQGSYVGKPLHGVYVVVSRDNTLIRKGGFVKGLKQGRWIKWYSNGNIEEIIKWRRGNRSGQFREYFADGKLRTTGVYKRNQLSGKLKTYDARGNKTTQKYKRGRLKKSAVREAADTAQSKSPWWKFRSRETKKSSEPPAPKAIVAPKDAPQQKKEQTRQKKREPEVKVTQPDVKKSSEKEEKKEKKKKSLTNKNASENTQKDNR